MKKFNMAELKLMSTPMSTGMTLDPDENGEVVDQREYMSMIDSLLYLTVTQPDIQFTVCMCVRFQSSPTLFTSNNSSTNLQVPQTHT
jgi:hypothetical protein